MPVTYIDQTPPNSSGAGAGATVVFPGSTARQLLVMVLGIEGAAAGSGPYVSFDPGHVFGGITAGSGWQRVLTQPPSAAGNGLEVWAAVWTSGPGTVPFWFGGTNHAYVAQGLVYTGQLDPGGDPLAVSQGIVRASTKQPWTGDNPECPSIHAFVGEHVIAVAADQLLTPGFGAPTPAGWSSRFDSARGSAYGNVEITAADKPAAVSGDTGAIPFAASAAASGTKGATATIAVRADGVPLDGLFLETAGTIQID